jgi:ATP-dependent DNA ligase
MIGYYFIQNIYRFVNGNERNENNKYSKEMTTGQTSMSCAQSAANIKMKESFDIEENENENLIHPNKNRINIVAAYKKVLKYIF